MEKRYAAALNPGKCFIRILHYLGYHKVKSILVIIIALVNVGVSLLGTSMLKPIIDDYVSPTISGLMSIETLVSKLTILTLILSAVYLTSFVLGLLQVIIMTDIAQSSVKKMREELFAKMQKLPLAFFDTTTHGELMSRYINDIDLVNEMFATSFLEILTSLVLLVGIVIMLFITNWLMALIAVLFFPLMLYLVRIFTKRARRNFDSTQKTMGDINGFVEETLTGQKIVKIFNKENYIETKFDKLNKKITEYSTNSTFYASIGIPIVNNMSNIIFILCTLIGSVFAFVVKIDWLSLSVGTLAVFIALVRQLNRPLNRTTNQLNIVQAALAGAERVFAILDMDEEKESSSSAWKVIEEDGKYFWKNGEEKRPVKGEVIFDNVDFSYTPGHQVLKNISFYARPGQKIAFVGSTGAGKTTITNLITRFYDIESGCITIDGFDIKDIDRKSIRSLLSLVLQDTHLFSGTIMDNIRYGRLDATDEECIAAAKLACASDFIEKLQDGYQTYISGENDSLSQGQRQLLSIARAAVNNTPILILDEATSSIDTRTERLIEKGMDHLMKGKTVLVIAHRLSTIRYSDAIMVIEQGKIIEKGNHDDLIAQKGRYFSLCSSKIELD